MTSAAALALPAVPHLPGRTPRPDEATFARLKADLVDTPAAEMGASAAFRGALHAFAAGYYWEAHELWEAVWMRLPPASAERVLLAALIQLANAGLKRRMGRERAAARILPRADAAVAEATRRGGLTLGLAAVDLDHMRRQVVAERKIAL